MHLLNEVLDLSKIDAGGMEFSPRDFDLFVMLRELAAMMQPKCEEKQLGLKLEIPVGRALHRHGDEVKLRQVLLNLLSNAVKFTHAGRVTLRVAPGVGERWCFEVEDTGAGIAAEEHERIFEPFQQGEAGNDGRGTGLGLAIARRQVEIMGGRLVVDSSPGHGSTFRFTLELPPAHEVLSHGAHPPREARGLAAGQHVRALVVDDIPENREVLAIMLTSVGCEVIVAENGRQALEAARVSRPGIVFMDIRMPGLDGLSTARSIIGEFAAAGMKVVALSASVLPHERESCLKAGCDDFIAKPVLAGRVHSCIEHLLGVAFDYGPGAGDGNNNAIDLGQLALPAELAERLAVAAELHSATVLKECLAELGRFGPPGERLARHLRGFLSSYDMKTIQHIVARIPVQ
jgi:CheY-like chemotaxis protein